MSKQRGVTFHRHFTNESISPYDEVKWEPRTASIVTGKGEVIFEQLDVEVPESWSQTTTNIVASKYFHGKLGSPERETSVKQLVGRVVNTITDWGEANAYFHTEKDADNFRADLTHLMIHQKACFNSPVWFNVGLTQRMYGWVWDKELGEVRAVKSNENRPQCSACFINSVEDKMESILDLAKTEGMLFKWGSGTGTNLSSLREEGGKLSGGGSASGPLSL